MPKTITFTDNELDTLSDMAVDAQDYRFIDTDRCRDCNEAQKQKPGRFDDVNTRCVEHAADRETAKDYAGLAEKIANA